ncbi:hypothetical protein [Streptomyces coelicoflavus]|nr:hypothetical protein [Streptomyces coelicoflavus]
MTLWTRVRVRNAGDVVDEYRFEPVGGPAPWTYLGSTKEAVRITG